MGLLESFARMALHEKQSWLLSVRDCMVLLLRELQEHLESGLQGFRVDRELQVCSLERMGEVVKVLGRRLHEFSHVREVSDVSTCRVRRTMLGSSSWNSFATGHILNRLGL